MGASTHSRESSEMLRDVTNTNTNSSGEEKKGLFGKWKAKMSERSEQKKLEKERAKSPPAAGHGQSRTSLSSTIASANQGPRGRSMDASRGSQSSAEGGPVLVEADRSAPTLETVTERPQTEARERADMSGLGQRQAAGVPPVPAVPQHVVEQEKSAASAGETVVAQPAENAAAATAAAPSTVAAEEVNESGQRPQEAQGETKGAADAASAGANAA